MKFIFIGIIVKFISYNNEDSLYIVILNILLSILFQLIKLSKYIVNDSYDKNYIKIIIKMHLLADLSPSHSYVFYALMVWQTLEIMDR